MYDDDAHGQFIRICYTCSVMKLTSLVICLLSPLAFGSADRLEFFFLLSELPRYRYTIGTSLHTTKIGMWATGIPNRHWIPLEGWLSTYYESVKIRRDA